METRVSDVAYCERRCQACSRDFVVVGRRRANAGITPAIELVSCPYCRDARRAMLAPDVEGPVSAVYTTEEWQTLRDTQAAVLSDEELAAIEEKSAAHGVSAADFGRVVDELRRLRVEASWLRLENDRLLERLRKQQ
jgi:hypothetical protein